MEQPVSLSPSELATREITPLLRPKESLIWAGQPQRGLHFSPGDAISVVASLPVLVALGTMATVLLTTATFPSSVKMFALPIGLVFFYLVLGRFMVAAYLRSHVFYGLTPQSVIIHQGGIGQRTQILDIKALSMIDIQLHGDKNHGTITFGKRPSLTEHPWQGIPTLPFNEPSPQFKHIPNAAMVCDEIDRLRVAARSRL